MKKTILLILLISFSFISYSQKGTHEKIKAYKIAFITEKLDLTTKEAQQFWPIYNAFSKKEKQYRIKDLRAIRKKIKDADGIDTFSDNEANNILNQVLQTEDNLHLLKQNLIKDLKPIISTKKILKLHHAEKEFNRKLLKKLQNNRKDRRP